MLVGCLDCEGNVKRVYVTENGAVYVCIKCGSKWVVEAVKNG